MELLREVLTRNLKHLRKQKGLTQAELCSALGITHSTYNQWEKGTVWPGSSNLEALATYYGIRSTRLFHDPDINSFPSSQTTLTEIKLDLQAIIDKLA
jgi:transcriptional regulator with XRE-family HTH domain